MKDLNRGATYRVATIDASLEAIPEHKVFNTYPGETFVYEPQRFIPKDIVMFNIRQGYITEHDLKVLCTIANFGSLCVTSRGLKRLLYMAGDDLGDNDHRMQNSIKRLARNGLIALGRFKHANTEQLSSLRIILLTELGSRIARNMGVNHKFNSVEVLTSDVIKSRAQTFMLLSNYLINLVNDIDRFESRPVLTNKALSDEAIVRPALKLTFTSGEDIYFEVPRRTMHNDANLEHLVDKLRRYSLVFTDRQPPVVIINGEDEEDCRVIYDYIVKNSDIHNFPNENL